jgi:hypothetical protein
MTNKRFNPKTMKVIKIIAPIAVALGVFLLLLLTQTVTAHAAPQHGFGRGHGRTDTVNVNDFHTNSWDRFSHNYQFQTGGDFRFELGNPTTFNGFVQQDVFTANVRRDAQVTVVPPRYGVFSGHVQTQPSNHLFPRPQSPHFANTFPQVDPNRLPRYDTLQMGVNAPLLRNPMNMHHVGQQGVLPHTSMGGNDLVPIGANNATGEHFRQGGEWFFQSGSNSSTVTTPAHDGFLPPTSIR